MAEQVTVVDRETNRPFDTQSKNEATIREILDVSTQIERYLDRYLFSSEWVTEDIPQEVEEFNPVTKQTRKVIKKVSQGRYRHLPSEERIVGCRLFGIDCRSQNFLPDTTRYYAVESNIFEGYCITYTDNSPTKIASLQRLKDHMMEAHSRDLSIYDLVYNAKWLDWDPMLNNKGFDSVLSYILINVAPINSTTILPENKTKWGSGNDEALNNQAVDDSTACVQDLILNHRQYGFSNNPTQILKLQRLMHKLFKLSLSRSINGIALRGIISTIEERRVNIQNEGQAQKEGGSSVFNKIIQR